MLNIPMSAQDVARRLGLAPQVPVETALMLLIWQTPTDRALSGWAPYGTSYAVAGLSDEARLGYLESSCSPPDDQYTDTDGYR